ncbi:V-type ATPase 116kDa subunit family protein [Paenibacillus hemerocallicola]|uniref:V-type ATPase 116kDa subunit family protein n=1 Tax=Paenibacillus hemerocallicola TaxID=1172614 RepID=A0A5C4TG29_9BACL|nr:V-type ATPase 116kDa subunit family protein [Paenibacillus hemerocallicola]TNJ68094.1 V-type ATPase 116kDa subunit family protein [Paenibacillus hemerocallicola]
MRIDYTYSPFVGLSIPGSIASSKWTRLADQNGDKQTTIKQDSLSISRQAQSELKQNGSQSSMMGRLMEQKQNLMERRQRYITQAMEKGTSPDVMEMELEEMDVHLAKIDSQLRELQLKEQRKALGVDDESGEDEKSNEEDRNGSAARFDGEQAESFGVPGMRSLISASMDIKQGSSVTRAQLTLNREAKFWEHSDPARSAQLRDKAEALDGKLLEIVGHVNEAMAEQSRETRPDESTPHDTSESRSDGGSRPEHTLDHTESAPDEERG